MVAEGLTAAASDPAAEPDGAAAADGAAVPDGPAAKTRDTGPTTDERAGPGGTDADSGDGADGPPGADLLIVAGPALAPFPDFGAAARATMRLLRSRLGFRLWLVTGVTGNDYVVLHAEPDDDVDGSGRYGPAVGDRFPWADTLCSLMSAGNPRVAPDLSLVPAYLAAPLAQQMQVGAYIAVPLMNPDGRMLGTLCALDPEPQPEQVHAELPLVEVQAQLLSTLLVAELQTDQQRRRAERAELHALVDPLTEVSNRRGWEVVLDREEQRCQRYGAAAGVIVVDLDDLKTTNDSHGHPRGDALLRRTAEVLREASRGADVVARTGGDEFAVLAIETSPEALQHDRNRLEHQLTVHGIAASVGAAAREHPSGLQVAWVRADEAMYEVKRQHHAARRAAGALPGGTDSPADELRWD